MGANGLVEIFFGRPDKRLRIEEASRNWLKSLVGLPGLEPGTRPL
jgi:hypothetical protein